MIDIQEVALLVHCFQVELECGVLVFCEGRKALVASTWTKNKLNPHVAPAGPGIDTGLQR